MIFIIIGLAEPVVGAAVSQLSSAENSQISKSVQTSTLILYDEVAFNSPSEWGFGWSVTVSMRAIRYAMKDKSKLRVHT